MTSATKIFFLFCSLTLFANCSNDSAPKGVPPAQKPNACAQVSADELVAATEGTYTNEKRDLVVRVSARPDLVDYSNDGKPRLYVHLPAVLGTYFPKGDLDKEFVTVVDPAACASPFGPSAVQLSNGENVELNLARSGSQLILSLVQTAPVAKVLLPPQSLVKVTTVAEIRELNSRLVTPVLTGEQKNKLDLDWTPTAEDAAARPAVYLASIKKAVYEGKLSNVNALLPFIAAPNDQRLHCALPVTLVPGHRADHTATLNYLLAHGNKFTDCTVGQIKRFDKRARFLKLFANSETLDLIRPLKIAGQVGVDRRLIAQDILLNPVLKAEGAEVGRFLNETNVLDALKASPELADEFTLTALTEADPELFRTILAKKIVEPNRIEGLLQRAELERAGQAKLSTPDTWLAGFELRQRNQRLDANLAELKRQGQGPAAAR